MNIKSLLLGSAAALVAVSGAKAADAVVAAEPEAVEYVRVCDVYGTGYFYIPGTETCLRVGGYVEYQFFGGDLFARPALDHSDGTVNDAWNQRTRFELWVNTAAETELGTLKTETRTRIDWSNGGGTAVSLNGAWIDLAGLRMGKDDSNFSTFLGYAGNVINDTLVPYGPFDTNFISYTFTGGNGFSAMIGAEEGTSLGGGAYGHDYTIDSYVPHFVAGAKITQGWGGFGVVGGYDSIHEQWAVKARLDVNVTDSFSAFVMAGYGSDDVETNPASPDFGGSFNYYKPWGGEWAVWGGATAKFNEKAAFNLQLGYDDADNFGAVANVAYELVPGFKITPEIAYYDSGTAGVGDAWGGGIRFRRSF